MAVTNWMDATQESLDSQQYSVNSIRHYELIYGEDFVSPGGRDMALELIQKMNLPEGSRVLDVGCGLGGSAFLMAKQFAFIVDAIDLSANMIQMAKTKVQHHQLENKVNLSHGDCLKITSTAQYDGVYSRDVFLHIHDKQKLFKVLHRVLNKNGQLLFTDYCCGAKPWKNEFTRYVSQRGYCLHTLQVYQELVEQGGFKNVICKDITERFIAVMRREQQRIDEIELSPEVKHDLSASWTEKIARAEYGDQRWGLVTATR